MTPVTRAIRIDPGAVWVNRSVKHDARRSMTDFLYFFDSRSIAHSNIYSQSRIRRIFLPCPCGSTASCFTGWNCAGHKRNTR